MGEDPNGIPSNLVPFLSQVLVGKLPYAQVYGSDYDTHDGTGVRDYIHVVDLALGHLAALNSIRDSDKGCVIYNMGSGRGYSVLEMIDAMQRVSGMELPYKIVERREGDAGFVVADPSLANLELGWKTERHLIEMCGDSWRWQSNNPHGYHPKLTAEK
ncbi:hypothetical protein HDV02_005304 [Globomyces sp. JEL0801]|nr:hypothetical protein HDV02_005304 [Globomyces sp. JEL0801]